MDRRALALRLAPVAGEAAARVEARWLLEAAGDDPRRLEILVARRLAGEPVTRVLGRAGFWTLMLDVTPAVLDPRPDTETVVAAARDAMLTRRGASAPLRILDLGTGSGAILLALLTEFPRAEGFGVDISAAALAVARGNAEALGLADRSRWLNGHWADGLDGTFDLVVSNPPYIPHAEIGQLEREVRDHDPLIALDGGSDGLDAYRAIVAALPRLLVAHGVAVLELGIGQADAVASLARGAGLDEVAVHHDLAGIARAIVLSKIP